MDKLNKNLSELYGAMIGDGCISKYFSNYAKKNIYCILLTGHTHDEPYYKHTIRPIFNKEFKIKGCIRFKEKDNAVRFETNSKRIFSWFVEQGFPIGKKINLEIPKIILQDNKLSLACVRGIFDTDGSIYNRYSKQYKSHTKKYNYKNIEIKMISEKIIKQIKNILDENSIKTSNIRKNKESYVLNIHSQKAIKLFYNLVKPGNTYHKERFLNDD